MVEPEEKRGAVKYLREQYKVSTSRACGVLQLPRSTNYYRSSKRDDAPLRKALREKASRRRRWGFPRLRLLLRNEGWGDNHKRMYRIYKEEKLQLKTRKRIKRRKWRGDSLPKATAPNQCWAMDFVHDKTVNHRKIRVLTIIDQYSRECVWLEVDSSLSGQRVVRVLDQLKAMGRKPRFNSDRQRLGVYQPCHVSLVQ